MQEEFRTWRDLLGWLIRDPREKHRIAEVLDVNPVTVTRWATSGAKPRPEKLRALVDALPHYRQELKELIVLEYPETFKDVGAVQLVEAIPSAFYARVLNIYTTSPPILRASSVCIAVLQQILSQLDPRQLGMAVFIAQCVPPRPNQKVRSLRKTLGRGTKPWSSHLELWTQFLGAESLPGYALSSGHIIVMRNPQEKEEWLPPFHASLVKSIAACPILLNDSTPGSLCIISMQPDYFSQEHLELIRNYANLLILAFDPKEFYTLNDLQLGVMPAYAVQLPYLDSFQERVKDAMILAAQEARSMTRPHAELRVWQELEEILLQHALDQAKLQDTSE